MSKEAMRLVQKWQQTDWNAENPMSADFAVSEANDVISALMDALREALAQHPAQPECCTKSFRYDLSPAMVESEIRSKLIELGWTPPGQPANRKPLTDEQKEKLWCDKFDGNTDFNSFCSIAEAIESAIKEQPCCLNP